MHPEQPRTGLALQKCQAESSPWGTRHTGLLGCLIQNARPLSFCFLLPRVQAAEVAAAQMSSTPSVSSSSTSPAAPPLSSVSTMRLNMGKPEFADTGWERLKDLFIRELVFFLPFFFTYLNKYILRLAFYKLREKCDNYEEQSCKCVIFFQIQLSLLTCLICSMDHIVN